MSSELAKELLEHLIDAGVQFFSGVPDSVLSDLSQLLQESPGIEHVIAPNEGSAVALGLGNFLGNGSIPVIYLQNSGLGNALNPLVSLAHANVYGIPMVLLIGFRGQVPGEDEPQHHVQGPASRPWLESVGIPVDTVRDQRHLVQTVSRSLARSRLQRGPTAVLIGRGVLDEATDTTPSLASYPQRSEIIANVVAFYGDGALYICTTGKASRELATISDDEMAGNAFLCIGGMGHASSVALGVSLAQPERLIVCIDGDGAFQMHMGASAMIGFQKPRNFVHIVVNNGVHDSVGGQPTSSPQFPFFEAARNFGYSSCHRVESVSQLLQALRDSKNESGPHFIEVLSNPGAETSLGRPVRTPRERMELLKGYGI